jgi:serine/threonine protein kinase
MPVTLTQQAGTPLYMAPEMYEAGDYTPAVDVFSFGLILYDLVVGDFAFSPSLTPWQLMNVVTRSDRPECPSDMSENVKGIILRCWSVEGDARGTFEDIWSDLVAIHFNLLGGSDVAKVSEFVSWALDQEPN